MERKKIRVFVSSPGDVRQERMIAKKVISELGKKYQDYVSLEAILWEDLPLEATASFQEGIDYFLDQAPIDIAIFILWSRLGSTLGTSYLKADGSPYASGTEYEFDMMYTLWERTQRPKIMVYVKDTEPQYGSGLNSTDIRGLLAQKDRLDRFIEEKFRDRETGTNYAYTQYDKQQTFEERLKSHLENLIRSQIGYDVTIREWEGNPYVGLRSYNSDESSIYCGRKGLVYDIVGKLLLVSDGGDKPTLFVLGESGSGKSSLVKAGILPQLMIETTGETSYNPIIVSPSSFAGRIYDGLVELFLRCHPFLEGNPVAMDLRNGIPDNYNFQYLRHALCENVSSVTPIIFIDQFEEMFSDNQITMEERKRCLQLLRGLSETRQVFMIFSMRNDFYSRFTSYPELGTIKNLSIVYDIPNVTAADIAEIVEEPARKANLHWERNEKGISLSKRIIEDAARLQNLPLIEFALSELYKQCSEAGEMTFDAYRRIGYLKGAVIQYANNFYTSLSSEEQGAFNAILNSVIAVSDEIGMVYVRKTASRSNLEKDPLQKKVVQKLVDAHLFVAGKDVNGVPTVTIVHEILLTSWDIVKEWCKQHHDFLQRNDHYEKLARYWKSNGCRKNDLILERSALLEAEYFMYHHEADIHPVTFEFLDKSLVRQRCSGLAKHIFLYALVVFFSIGFVCAKLIPHAVDKAVTDFFEFDFNSLSWWDILFMTLPVLLASSHAVYLRIARKYKYKSIRSSALVWLAIIVCVVIGACYDYMTGQDVWSGIIVYGAFCISGLSVFMEYRRRKLWKKHTYKPYLMADRFETAKNIVLWSVLGIVLVVTMVAYICILAEKNEQYEEKNKQYESTLLVADELFDGLNNISKQLSWPDNLYINLRRKNYLEERFRDELLDTIPDRREWEYATCLYNLYEPYEALNYLYPGSFWNHHCFYVLASAKAGLTTDAEYALEEYVKDKRISEKDVSWIPHTHLIWTAEKLGRYDLADSIYSILCENDIDWSSGPGDLTNYGHIQLMKGDIDTAIGYYKKAIDVGVRTNPAFKEERLKLELKQMLANDFATLRWLGTGINAYIDEAEQELDLETRTFYTSVADSITTNDIHQQLIGEWALADSSIVLIFHPDVPLCQYRVHSQGQEINRMLTNCRFSRHDGHLYWEELNSDSITISSCEITSLADSAFSVKIIENGNEIDRGTIRTYYKNYTE